MYSKISEKEFWEILAKNNGVFLATSVAISKRIGKKYTRQAVRLRATAHPEKLEEIQEANVDMAESGLYKLINSKNASVKQRAIEFTLKTKGKQRGFGDQVALTDPDGKPIAFKQTMVINGKEIEF